MGYRAVLDASVLYPFSLRDTLLRLSEAGLYDCFWSDRILDEVTNNLIEDGKADEAGARRLAALMDRAFEDASVDSEAVEALEPQMTNDPKDRHVMATAVAGVAHAVVTSNLKHFPISAAEPHGIGVVSPDDFLVALYETYPGVTQQVLVAQAAALRQPPWSFVDLLDALDRAGVPRFSRMIREDGLPSRHR